MSKLPSAIALLAGALASTAGSSQTASPAALPAQLTEPAPCVADAARYHGVNPWVLRAILKVESNFDARAVNRNANGSIDVGMAQINSIHFTELGRWGVLPANLMDGCVATYVAAWHLARQIRTHGNSWFGVASYHSTSPCQNARYAGLLWNALVGWRVVAGPQVRVAGWSSCSAGAASAAKANTTKVAANGKRDHRAPPALAFDEAP